MKRMRGRCLTELPAELQAEIFLRLQVRCLMKCKRVCKSIYNIIQNPDFGNAHSRFINTDTPQEALIFQSHYNNGISHFLFSIDNATKDSLPVIPQIPNIDKLRLVGSANGLICFYGSVNDNWDGIYLLWNPVTRHTRCLPKPEDTGFCFSSRCIKEFGFVPETYDYKILVAGYMYGSDKRIQIQLYKVSMDSWTIVDCGSLIDFDSYQGDSRVGDLFQSDICVLLNGCFHWAANGNICHYIVSFNLKDEKLGLITSPNHHRTGTLYSDDWKVAIVEESLAVMYWSYGDNFQIWVMNEYGVKDSWVLRFQLRHIVRSRGFWNHNLIISEHGSLHLYDINTKERKLLHSGADCETYVSRFSSFVFTLAPVRIPS